MQVVESHHVSLKEYRAPSAFLDDISPFYHSSLITNDVKPEIIALEKKKKSESLNCECWMLYFT